MQMIMRGIDEWMEPYMIVMDESMEVVDGDCPFQFHVHMYACGRR